MRRLICVFSSLTFLSIAPASATVAVAIDLSHQTMHVQSSSGSYDWPISSARSGFSTPGGSYAPTRLEAMHYSHKYHMSPMPHSIFFRGGYAIHGTYATGSLGRPASHGCVRLSPGNAARLYDMVKAEGARISISGAPPQGPVRYHPEEQRMPIEASTADSYDADATPRAARPRRLARRTSVETAYYGYRFVGRVNGRNVYQATAPATDTAGSFWGANTN